MGLIEMHLTWNMRQLLCLRENMAIGIQIQEKFFPEFYIPMELFWEDKKLSVSALVKLAALNAAVVIGNYTPVEYKRI